MKKTALSTTILFVTCLCAKAQNTLPSTGSVGIGTTSPLTLFHIALPDLKTTATYNIGSFISTSETGNPFGLRTSIFGASTIANRYATLQTTDFGLVDGGNIVLQPAAGNVGIGANDTQGNRFLVNGAARIIGDFQVDNPNKLYFTTDHSTFIQSVGSNQIRMGITTDPKAVINLYPNSIQLGSDVTGQGFNIANNGFTAINGVPSTSYMMNIVGAGSQTHLLLSRQDGNDFFKCTDQAITTTFASIGNNGEGRFGIGTNEGSAVLQANSTTMGFLSPRMTNAQRDAIYAPAEGLEIYSTTDHAKEVYNGSSWQIVGFGGSGTLTPGSVVFAGTGGNIAQDNSNLFWNSNNHSLGIGTATPAYPLQVNQSLNGTGTIAVTTGSGTITGTGTDFATSFNIGDVINANGETHTISAIASSTSMTTDNWSSAYNGQYTTSNTQHLALAGNGNLYLGNVSSASSNDGVFNIITAVSNRQGRNGMISSFSNAYTTAPNTLSDVGASFLSNITASNTQNWTAANSLIGLQSTVITKGSSIATVTGVVGVRSQIGNGALSAHVTNAYMYQGAVQPFNVTHIIGNLAGMLLYNLNAGTNNTGVFLDIGTPAVVSALPAGNWGIYDNTGYNNYFAGSVGIGTTTPYAGAKFQTKLNTDVNLGIDAGNSTGAVRLDAYNDAANANIPLELQGSTVSLYGSGAALGLFVNSAGSVGIGTNNPKSYKFAVAGSAVAESMTVQLQSAWPDYTFKKDYKLMPLAELKTYVDKNQHLPEIPSAAQVEKDGINLGEMNRLLLKKVEELTLYLIEKDKNEKNQEEKMALQEARIKKLEQQIIAISKQ